MRFTSLPKLLPETDSKEGQPELVRQELVQYLSLTGMPNGEWDQEDLEWPLLLVAQELGKLLLKRGFHWEVPFFERSTQLKVEKGTDRKLLLPVPRAITWKDYEKAIQAALERRRDCWVVQIRFERIVAGECLRVVHKGPLSGIPARVEELVQFAEKHNLQPQGYFHELFLSDPDEALPSEMKTVVLLPVKEVC